MRYSHLLSGLPPAVVDDALDLRLELPLEQPHAPRVVARLLGVVDARQRRLPLPPSARRRRRREEVSGHYGPSRPPIRSALIIALVSALLAPHSHPFQGPPFRNGLITSSPLSDMSLTLLWSKCGEAKVSSRSLCLVLPLSPLSLVSHLPIGLLLL